MTRIKHRSHGSKKQKSSSVEKKGWNDGSLSRGILLVLKEDRKHQSAQWSTNPFLSALSFCCTTAFWGELCQIQQRGDGKLWPGPKSAKYNSKAEASEACSPSFKVQYSTWQNFASVIFTCFPPLLHIISWFSFLPQWLINTELHKQAG